MKSPKLSDGHIFRLTRVFHAIFSGATVLMPWLGLLGLGLLSLKRQGFPIIAAWWALWLGALLPPSASTLLRGDWSEFGLLQLQLLLLIVASSLLFTFRKTMLIGLWLTLGILACIGVWQHFLTTTSWRSYDETAMNTSLDLGLNGNINHVSSYSSRRLWRLTPGVEAFELQFEARLHSGVPGWDWQRSHSDYQLEAFEEGSELATRVTTPNDNDPHLVRNFDFNETLSNRTVRLTFEIRNALDTTLTEAGLVYLYGNAQNHIRRSIDLTPIWLEHEIVWHVSSTFDSSRLSVVLNDFNGHIYEIRNVNVELEADGTWITTRPPAPTGAAVWLDLPYQNTELRSEQLRFMPDETWQDYTLRVQDESLTDTSIIRAVLLLERGVTIETRRVRLVQVPADAPATLAKAIMDGGKRFRFWYAHPNLAGHTVAVAILVLLCTVSFFNRRLIFWLSFGVLFAFILLYLTGSRAAWLATLIGVPWLTFLSTRSRSWKAALLLLLPLVSGLIAAYAFSDFSQSRLFNVQGGTRRLDIWQVAFKAFLENPWVGLGSSGFPDFWQTRYQGSSQELVSHAHNLWLAFASSYGILGLLGALWLTTGLIYLAWHWGRWRGLALVIPVFVMQIFDYTLFYSGVLFPLILGMNTLRERSKNGD